MTLQDFIEGHGVRMACDWADENPNMDDMPDGSTHYRCLLRYGRRRLTVPFSMGPAHCKEPELADVLDCLASDACSYDNARDFEDWCAEYGYDTDSRKAERTYRAVERQREGLYRLLGDEAYRELLEAERL